MVQAQICGLGARAHFHLLAVCYMLNLQFTHFVTTALHGCAPSLPILNLCCSMDAATEN